MKALRVGEVTDVGYSKEGRVTLIVKVEGGEERIIPFTMVREIGDIILLKSSIEAKPEIEAIESSPPQPKILEQAATATTTATQEIEGDVKACPECGRRNIARAKFCVKCGHRFSS